MDIRSIKGAGGHRTIVASRAKAHVQPRETEMARSVGPTSPKQHKLRSHRDREHNEELRKYFLGLSDDPAQIIERREKEAEDRAREIAGQAIERARVKYFWMTA